MLEIDDSVTDNSYTNNKNENFSGRKKGCHSIKVPKLYKEASKALIKVEENSEGIKTAIYSCKHPNMKAVTALVSETLRHSEILEKILVKSKLRENEPGLALPLAKILITELLWGKKRLGGNAKPIETINKYKEKLEKILERIERKERSTNHLTSDNSLNSSNERNLCKKPRYVRVNTLLSTLEDTITYFINEGWNEVDFVKNLDSNIDNLSPDDFCRDPFVPNMLVFHTSTQFHAHELYLNGSIILQDKASCLPPLALKPRSGRNVIDACAAPGMKTSLISALMGNEGKILAVEKNGKRGDVLQTLLKSYGVSNVEVRKMDFTDLNPSEFEDVEYILVDPSCSGSGMVGRIDSHNFKNSSNSSNFQSSRLESLSYCQLQLLLHAMRFPNVKRIVYSTCSIHSEENEDVVGRALQESNGIFKLKNCLPEWEHRVQNPNYEWSELCVSANYEMDRTDGFFVALFERIKFKK